MTHVALDLFFANQDALVDFLRLPVHDHHRHLPAAGDLPQDAGKKQHALISLLASALSTDPLPELARLLLTETPAMGAVVVVEQDFYFRRDPTTRMIHWHGRLNTDDRWTVKGRIDPARLPFASAAGLLSGHRHVFVVGSVIGTTDDTIELRALFIGNRRWVEPSTDARDEPRRIAAQDVDHFAGVDWTRGLTQSEITRMREMPERDVKAALAEIIGVPFVPKDWGGERSDLVTTNLMVHGLQTTAAWLLKGKSVKGTMQIPHLGTNGDQVERLATEPVDVLVVQHNGPIASAVVNLVQTFAYDMRRPRRFMILDGQQTALILTHFDLMP